MHYDSYTTKFFSQCNIVLQTTFIILNSLVLGTHLCKAHTHLHHQVACMGCTWALVQRLGQTSWVVAVWTLKCWGSQRNGWSPSVQTRGQEAQQCFLVAAKMGETLFNLEVKRNKPLFLKKHKNESSILLFITISS